MNRKPCGALAKARHIKSKSWKGMGSPVSRYVQHRISELNAIAQYSDTPVRK